MAQNIEERDIDLLKKERIYRKNSNWVLFALVLLLVGIAPLVQAAHGGEMKGAMAGAIIVAILYSRYCLSIKLRHIESVKPYRTRLNLDQDEPD